MHPKFSSLRWAFVAVCAAALSAPAQTVGPLHSMGDAFAQAAIRKSDRTVLGDGIVHYRYTVAVGRGKYDVILVHRIVKERHPFRPVRTVNGVLLLPGSPNSFEGIFMEPLISEVPAWDRSVAVFLAKNNVDVWGMDYGWAAVPEETTDFSFMKGWGIAKDNREVESALSVARWIRVTTGQGFGPLHLLGFSWGAILTYPIAGEETRKPAFLRSVKGIIAVDAPLVFPSGSPEAATGCNDLARYQAMIDSGIYVDTFGVLLRRVAGAAIEDANGSSVDIPGLTNSQAGLYLGASGTWHFAGGYFDDQGIPTGLRFTEPRLWFDLLKSLPPYCPVQEAVDLAASQCGMTDVPFDDNLSRITLPILYVGSRGGWGEAGYYTTTRTGSKDITKFTVQLLPDDQRAYDFGHADLFMATNAETLVWRPILDWLLAHP